MSDLFNAPSSGDQFKAADHNGDLCLFEITSYEQGVVTAYGETDAVRGTVTVLGDEPTVYTDSLIFGRALIGSLKNAAGGKPVLGRIGKGTAKPGQSAPWVLVAFDEKDAQKAETYLKSRKTEAFTPAPPF